MNWDWDKLQEKRQRQDKNRPPQGGDGGSGDGKNPFENFNLGKLPKNPLKSGLPILPIIIVLGLLWLSSGVFIVNPGQEAVILRFGKYDRIVGVGPHLRLPTPLEQSIIVNTELVRTVDIGVAEGNLRTASPLKVMQSSMFTGDENIVHMHFNVQYSISDAKKYLFSVKDPSKVIENAAEAAMREVVGQSKIEPILTQGREEVQTRTLVIIQTLLASYDMGIKLHAVQLGDVYPPAEVKEAFIDVASAREARNTIENKAKAYRAEIVPVATGSAKSMVNSAMAYSETITKTAEGEAARFLLMVDEFNKAREITKKRLYLEKMQEVLSSQGIEKIIISSDAKGALLPHINLGPEALPAAQRSAISQGERK